MSELRQNPSVPAQRDHPESARSQDTRPPARTPEQIAADLAETRERLADTVDTLVARVQPKEIAGRTAAAARGLVVDRTGGIRVARLAKVGIGVVGVVAVVWALRRVFRR